MTKKYYLTTILLITVIVFSGFLSNAQNSSDTLPEIQTSKTLPKFRIGAQIGYGYRTAPIDAYASPEMKTHNTKLKNNLCFGADMSYYFKKNFGIGIKYNGIYAGSLSTNIRLLQNDLIYHGLLSEKIGIHFMGGFLSTRFFPNTNNKHFVFVNVGAGYVRFRDNMIIINLPVKITGNTAAFVAELGYDFWVTKHLAIGFQVAMMIGSLKFIDITVGNETERVALDKLQRENLTHVDITLGFRFYK